MSFDGRDFVVTAIIAALTLIVLWNLGLDERLDELSSVINTLTEKPAGRFTGERRSVVNRSLSPGVHEIPIPFREAPVSLRITGSVEGDGAVRAVLADDRREVLVFMRDGIEAPSTGVSGESQDSIKVNLSYAHGSRWDANDNGWASDSGVIDYSITGTIVDNALDRSRLCTEWMVYSEDNRKLTSTCVGDINCCIYLGFSGVPDSRWDEPLFLYRGKYDATENNLVAAQVAYVNLNLGELQKDIRFSRIMSLPAVFRNLTQSFERECADSCNFPGGSADMRLRVEVDEDTKLHLQEVEYTTTV